MANTTTMTYGGDAIKPVPLISVRRDSIAVKNREDPIGYTFSMTLTGTLTPIDPDVEGEAVNFVTTEALTHELRETFNKDCKLLEIKCDDTVVLQCYPRIKTIDFRESNNNWIQTIPYTIELEYDTDESNEHPNEDEHPPFIESYNEEWQFEFLQEAKYFQWDLSGLSNQEAGHDYSDSDGNNPFEARVTHTLSVVGKRNCGGSGGTGVQTGVESALQWIDLNTNYSSGVYNALQWGHAVTGINNLTSSTGTGFRTYDHFRSHVINEVEGNVSLTESWIVAGANTGLVNRNFREDFTVNMSMGISDSRTKISIQGQIQGFEERDYTGSDMLTNVTGQAYNNASNSWGEITDRIFPRAQKIYQAEGLLTKLNPAPTTKTVGHSPARGIITYNYEFDDRPCLFISGALSEQFTIVDVNPTDVFAKLAVLGRPQGPILQEMSTVTEPTREVTIEAVMPLPTGCSSITDLDLWNPNTQVEALLCEYETQLTTANDQVFKHADTANWNPTTGRFSRTVGWTYAKCSGEVSTSFSGLC